MVKMNTVSNEGFEHDAVDDTKITVVEVNGQVNGQVNTNNNNKTSSSSPGGDQSPEPGRTYIHTYIHFEVFSHLSMVSANTSNLMFQEKPSDPCCVSPS